jgi:hypothetical protein
MQIHLFNAIHNILIYIHIIFMFIDVSAAKVLQKRCPSRLSIESWIFSWAMSRRFQFPFTDFSLVLWLRLRADISKVTAHERIQHLYNSFSNIC